MDLISAVERFSAIDRSKVVFDSSRCLYSIDRFSLCQACFNLCPNEAIKPGKPPIFNAEQCVNCLACLPACLSGAFISNDYFANLLSCANRLENAAIELICDRQPSPQLGANRSVIGLRMHGCLAGLGASSYLALAAMGVEKIIVRTDACPECDWESLQVQINNQISDARQLLALWAKENAIETVNQAKGINLVERIFWNVDNPPLSRRDLFRFASRQGQVALARFLEVGNPIPGHLLGQERQRLLAAIAHMPDSAPLHDQSIVCLGFASLSINESCTACGACARACPTGALKLEKSEELTFSLRFSASMCINCSVCVHVCAVEAIAIEATSNYHQIKDQASTSTLFEGHLTRCARCSALFTSQPDHALCPNCEFRRNHPFGSRKPLTAKNKL